MVHNRVTISVPTKVPSLRKMRKFGQNFSISAPECQLLMIDKQISRRIAQGFLCRMKVFYNKNSNFRHKVFQT